jgi:hypothetical protein
MESNAPAPSSVAKGLAKVQKSFLLNPLAYPRLNVPVYL